MIPLDSPQAIETLAAAVALALEKIGGTAGGESLTVNVYAAGSILTEQDLIDVVHRGLLQKQKSNGTLGLVGR